MKLDAFPVAGLLPKEPTQASALLTKHPEYDGRGTVIAILDTGVCPMAPGLQVTTENKPKIIDIIDCTGAGDVSMGAPIEAELQPVGDNEAEKVPALTGVTGRRLLLNPAWTAANPSTKFRLGLLRGFSVFGPVLGRVTKDRKEEFLKHHAKLEAAVQSELAALATGTDADKQKDVQDRLDALKQLAEKYEDAGPVYDVVAFYDGTHWRVVVDTLETGDLRDQPALASYRFEGQHHRFGHLDNLAFSVNVYDQGATVSVVTLSGSHGTHVAGIAAACHPEAPELNGIAPGAQIVSLRIGDTRLGSMETGAALSRATLAMVQNKVDLANISYGEASHVADVGRFINLLRDECINKHGIAVVSSAGNAGPALSTVGAPGGTTDGVISVGAHVGRSQMLAEYAFLGEKTVPEREYTWTSRGPDVSGGWGTSIYAPGSAITSIPSYSLAGYQLMNGTSMSSPNACGNLALLISGWKQMFPTSPKPTPYRILRAVQHTGVPVETDPFKRPFVQIADAWDYLVAHKDDPTHDVHFKVSIGEHKMRGVYLRGVDETHTPFAASATIKPVFPTPSGNAAEVVSQAYFTDLDVPNADVPAVPEVSVAEIDAANKLKLDMDLRLALIPSHPWIRVPAHAQMTSEGRVIPLEVDAHLLAPGLHVGKIEAWDTAKPHAKGPLVSFPVTVAKPYKLGDEAQGVIGFNNVAMSPGHLERKFVAVPDNASFVDIAVRSRPNAQGLGVATGANKVNSPALFLVRTVQLAPQRRYPDYDHAHMYRLRPEATGNGDVFEVKRQKVVPGLTMEVVLGQYWNATGEHIVDVELTFHGITLAPSMPGGVVQGDLITRFELASTVRREEDVGLSVSIDNVRKYIRPTTANISPLSASRDITPDTRQVYQLVQSYPLKVTDAASVSPRYEGIGNVLYDFPCDAYLVLIHDAAGRLIATHDMYAKSIKLEKGGEYTIRTQIRHDAIGVLEKLKDLPLAVDFPAPKASVDLYGSFNDALTRGSKLPAKLKLNKGDRRAVFAVMPADVKDAKPGDVLVASIGVSEGGKSKIDGGFAPLLIAVTNAKANSTNGNGAGAKTAATATEEPKPTLAEKIRDVQIAHLKTLKDDKEAAAALATEIDAAFPNHLPLLEAKLELAAGTPADELVAAEALLAAIDRKDLAADLALTAHEKEPSATRKSAEARKATLVKALLKRASALVAVDGAAHADVKAAIDEYKQWALDAGKQDAIPSFDALALFVAQLVEAGSFGAALKAVNKYLGETAPAKENVESIKKALALRREVLSRLGWIVYVENENKWSWVRFPAGGAVAPF
ncbi:subtilase family-domain-containing protein [Catenaria anguillulae PL171]|uniref:tripeptidyl-peptidase II n=1 Tax=Catenaria anguillulae PL171 TaxID=765915 RepID=A0A1Y2H7Z2_9FUNG|nr:subtilase family-domain-containing protein [Catenaria anguillulae PL171]